MSTLRVNTIQDSTGSGTPAINGLAKAWVNFNGTGTVAIRASFNVSSITDDGTGSYAVNFTTAMSDSNYSVVSGGYNSTGTGFPAYSTVVTTVLGFPYTSGIARVKCYQTNASGSYDTEYLGISVFR